MTKITNITTDDLGYQGQTFPAGQTVDLPDEHADSLLQAHPEKFVLASPVKANTIIWSASTSKAASPMTLLILPTQYP